MIENLQPLLTFLFAEATNCENLSAPSDRFHLFHFRSSVERSAAQEIDFCDARPWRQDLAEGNGVSPGDCCFNGAGVRTLRGADRSVDDYNYEPRVCPRGGGV